MTFGLGTLRLQPEAFWNLTLRELDMLLAGDEPLDAIGLSRSELKFLMREHPDKTSGANDGR